eukprot:gene34205-64569_t
MFRGWQRMCELTKLDDSWGPHCQDTPYCAGGTIACLPHWKADDTLTGELLDPNGSGSAPDGDEDMLKGLVMVLLATEEHKDALGGSDPAGRWDEMGEWAHDTCRQFYDDETEAGGANGERIAKLGSCWGGWSCNNPSYHDPAMYRLCRNWMKRWNPTVGAEYEPKWNELVQTTYKILEAAQYPATGLVPNWYVPCGDEPSCEGTTTCSGSGTPAEQYGSEAARTTWRI